MVEGTDTGCLSELEKEILENYGIDSETDVSLLDQDELHVSKGLNPMQLKKLDRCVNTLASSLNAPGGEAECADATSTFRGGICVRQ
jgi:hypothetical protein